MRLPSLILFAFAGVALTTPALAAPDGATFEPPALPPHLSIRDEHVPKPIPEDGEIEFRRSGPGGWTVAAGFFLGAAATAGVVAGVEHARYKRDEDPSATENARKVRNAVGYGALGATGAAGVCLVLNQVW